MKSNLELKAKYGVGLTLYVEAKLPVNGVAVKVIVYGKDECATLLGVSRDETRDESAAEVPAKGLLGFALDVGGGPSIEGVSAVNRSPVLSPMTCEKGE